MKTAEYKLPMGVHPSFEPTEVTPEVRDASGKITTKAVFAAKIIKTREAETLAEFGESLVETDKPESHVLSLAQGQYDIIVQRKVREFFQSSECADMMDGKTDDTKDLDEDARFTYVLGVGQAIADEYRYGSRGPATGGANAAAKKTHAQQAALAAAAANDPEVAALLAQQQALLAKLGLA